MPSNQARLATLALAGGVAAGSLADIDHVVLFMQENRAFDHYFGTMAGVRGFKDPNALVSAAGVSVFRQQANTSSSSSDDYLLPWYLNYLGDSKYDWSNATQCMVAGSNGWSANQGALNHDANDRWVVDNTPYSWGHFTREELPAHYAIADAFVVGDMYQEGVITSTSPNRVTWISGSINAPGSPINPKYGMYIDNSETPGCEAPGLNCYPIRWKTYPQYLEEAGVSWQVYQDTDNFDDNPLAWQATFQQAKKGSALNEKGLSFLGLESFYKDAAEGTLKDVNFIIGPAELSEHPPYQPRDGAWLQTMITNTVLNSKYYNSTVLMISYDETGGWGDHVVPFHSPNGTVGEWVEDPYGEAGYVYTGPGFRLPFTIVSPWTRNGGVYVEHADHNSQILFLEKWLASKGKNVVTKQMDAWRRENMADLTMAFDFANPDYSIPTLPNISYPSTNKEGQWNGYAVCEQTYSQTQPPPPYGSNLTEKTALQTEQGFKPVRGQLTEGRYLTFEMNGYALANSNGRLSATKASSQHNSPAQRFIISGDIGTFNITSAVDGKSVAGTGALAPKSQPAKSFTINDLGNGQGYTVKASSGQYMSISKGGMVKLGSTAAGFDVFSVTYDN